MNKFYIFLEFITVQNCKTHKKILQYTVKNNLYNRVGQLFRIWNYSVW